MKIAITGSSGLIGSALTPALRDDGHTVLRLVRRPPAAADEARWDPDRHELDPAVLADVDAVINLAGAGIGDKRWSDERKKTIMDSRVDATETVAAALAAEPRDGRILLSGSAIGWYGDTGDTAVDETAPAAGDYLAEITRRWEGATEPAAEAGVRVALLRTGLVCGRGGLLGRLIPLVKVGLGAPVGSGRQWWSWISLADEVGAIRHLLTHDVSGPVNLVGPAPLTNRDFTKVLGRVLHRPVLPVPVPVVALRVLFGEFADVGIAAGQRVMPRVLERTGYQFQHETAEKALRWATSGAA